MSHAATCSGIYELPKFSTNVISMNPRDFIFERRVGAP